MSKSPLSPFHPAVRDWFECSARRADARAGARVRARSRAGESTLLLAPTGSGKTLAAFLAAIDRLAFAPEPPKDARCRVLYVSPLKALAVDVERNLRAPLAGIVEAAERRGDVARVADGRRAHRRHAGERARADGADAAGHPHHDARVALPAAHVERARDCSRTSRPSSSTRSTRWSRPSAARTSFLSLERLEALRAAAPEAATLQRIGLSATQRPLDEIARLLGGFDAAASRAPSRSSTRAHKKRLDLPSRSPTSTWRGSARSTSSPRDPLHPAADPADDLAARSPATRRARPRAPLDDDLRQQPPPRRAPRERAQRDGGRRDRARAPRLGRAREAARRSRSA